MVYDVDSEKKANKICAAAGQPRRQEVPPGANVEAVAMFFGSLAGMQKRIMGDRLHICRLGLFSPSPPHPSSLSFPSYLDQWSVFSDDTYKKRNEQS